jgi:hypothetical protein
MAMKIASTFSRNRLRWGASLSANAAFSVFKLSSYLSPFFKDAMRLSCPGHSGRRSVYFVPAAAP